MPSPSPGGRIGVHTGLLRVADHGNERLTQQLGIKAVLMVVGFLGEGDLGQQLMQALGLGDLSHGSPG